MIPEMRKAHKQMDAQMIEKTIQENDYGVLSVITADGYPYGVPMNYAYVDDCFILHGGNKGYRYDSLKNNPQACFTIVGRHDVLTSAYSTAFTSVIAIGKVDVLDDPNEKAIYLRPLIDQLAKEYKGEGQKHMDGGMSDVAIFVFHPEHMTGKKNRLQEV